MPLPFSKSTSTQMRCIWGTCAPVGTCHATPWTPLCRGLQVQETVLGLDFITRALALQHFFGLDLIILALGSGLDLITLALKSSAPLHTFLLRVFATPHRILARHFFWAFEQPLCDFQSTPCCFAPTLPRKHPSILHCSGSHSDVLALITGNCELRNRLAYSRNHHRFEIHRGVVGGIYLVQLQPQHSVHNSNILGATWWMNSISNSKARELKMLTQRTELR